MASKGGSQRSASPTAVVRKPDLSHFWGQKLPPVTAGDFAFHFDVLPGEGAAARNLDTMVQSFEYEDQAAVTAANLQLMRPDPERRGSIPVGRGMRVRARVRWDQGLHELWVMRAKPIESTLDGTTAQGSLDLEDDLAALNTGSRQWTFRRTRSRRHGYTADEVARHVAKVLGVKVRRLAKGTHRFPKLVKTGTGLDTIRAAYALERGASGRAFVIRMRGGELEVVPYAYNPVLYAFADQIRNAVIQQQPLVAQPVTVYTGRGHVGKGHKAKKVSYTAYDRAVTRRFGYRHRVRNFGQVDSVAALRKLVHRELAKNLRVNWSGTVQVQGIPFIFRGDAVELNLPHEGLTGKNKIVFITAVRHQGDPASYTTEFDFRLKDPFAQAKADREAALRAKKRKARQKRRGG